MYTTKEQDEAMRKAGENLFEQFKEASIDTRAPYNWYHAHGLPDPANGNEVLAYRVQEEIKRKVAKEEVFWQDVVVPNIVASEEVAKVEEFLLPAGEWEGVVPQCITEPSDIKIGFR